MDYIQPYITGIIQAIVGLLATIVIAALLSLRSKVNVWLASKTTDSQRDMLHKLGSEAYAFAESVFNEQGGPEKYKAAYTYLSIRLGERGIKIGESEIRAIIEKAVLDYSAIKKEAKPNGPI